MSSICCGTRRITGWCSILFLTTHRAAVTVSTVNALLRGDIAPSVHFADDVLMATQTFNDVIRPHPGTQIRQYLPDEGLEEGKL